jgi:hypothetical protein
MMLFTNRLFGATHDIPMLDSDHNFSDRAFDIRELGTGTSRVEILENLGLRNIGSRIYISANFIAPRLRTHQQRHDPPGILFPPP